MVNQREEYERSQLSPSNNAEMSSRKRMPSYRIWGSADNGDIEFESLTAATLEGALKVIRESFFKYESVCIGVDLSSEPGAAEELEDLCRIAAKDGVSVVAVEVSTGEVVSVAFNKIQILQRTRTKSSFETFMDNCKFESSQALVAFMHNVDSRLNLFEHHNVENILEIMFLATLPSHGQRRLGELVTAASVEIGRQLKSGNDVKTPVEINGDDSITNKNSVPELVSALCTSEYSHKIFEKLGFDSLLSAEFTEFECRGKKFSDRIGDLNKFCHLVTKRLSPTPPTPKG
ncbi:arylalkylamine N-acetyltransferase 1 [Athalia rosae]|uniref:arylalkylamine N-acetyltransferase 1 n=1 Tax=Athalia rosae TaxID=37344 RepID=UPI0006264478|nr:arylalkylamine N-acetyltransferase 1 [Athalia rosae]XP_048516174.1 arylalkylamine N-acetyltransferase 1 [Athalia rosae]